MNEMIVAVFDSEEAALKGMQALEQLHEDGGISLYSSALIVKDKKGKLTVKRRNDRGPLGTALGMLTGAIVGILGGPAGSAIGISLGGYLGALADCVRVGIDLQFLEDVGKTVNKGRAAVLAEVEENWVLVLEPRLTEFGGTVFRRFRTDVVEDRLLQESKALDKEIDVLLREFDKTGVANRKAIQDRIKALRQQLEAIRAHAQAEIDRKQVVTDLMVEALRDQAETAASDAKLRLRRRVAEAQADFKARSKKLNQARGSA